MDFFFEWRFEVLASGPQWYDYRRTLQTAVMGGFEVAHPYWGA